MSVTVPISESFFVPPAHRPGEVVFASNDPDKKPGKVIAVWEPGSLCVVEWDDGVTSSFAGSALSRIL
jgi:hypothetical protein